MLSVYTVLAALLGATVPQAARRLIDAYGWRTAYLGLGIAVVAIGLPTLALLLHEPSRGAARAQTAPPPLAASMTAREVRRTATYWQIVAAVSIYSAAIQAVYAHMAPLLIERGLTRITATNALSLYSLASVFVQLGTGFLLDRSRSPRVSVPVLALSLVGVATLYVANGATLAVVGSVLMGASIGAEISLAKFLHVRYFGNRAFGEVFGVQFLFIGLSAGVGPIAMGFLHDATGGYQTGILLAAGMLLISVLIIARLPPYAVVQSLVNDMGVLATASGGQRDIRMMTGKGN
jgi:cyanate permease